MLNNKILKPIFIVGVPRSGTTMLYRMFCRHPELAWFSHEDLQYLYSKDTQEKLKKKFIKMKENNEKIPRTEESLFVFGLKQGTPLPGTSKVPIEAESFWSNCFGRKYVTDISDDKKNEVIQGIQTILENQKKIRFLNKSPGNSNRIFAFKKIFPDAKFINIAKEPRSVIASMLTRREQEGQFNVDHPFRNKPISKIKSFLKKKNLPSSNVFDATKDYANSYKEITEILYDFSKSNHENFITVIYEELLAQPEKEINRLLEFCELEKPMTLDDLISTFEETQSKWKEKLSENDEKNIFKIIKPSIKKMNYPYKL